MRLISLILFCFLLSGGVGLMKAEPINVSDPAIERFLEFPFQYDYTRIKDDSSFREFINALDNQLATVDYRQRLELSLITAQVSLKERYSPRLEERYDRIFDDGFMFSLLKKWREKTQDPINRIFAEILLIQYRERLVEPGQLRELQSLLDRVADRLFNFQFALGDKIYSAPEAAVLVEESGDVDLARELYQQQNDSAAIIADDAARLYYMYQRLGERFGYKTSFDYNLSFLSYDRKAWFQIAQNLKEATEDEYTACLEALRDQSGREELRSFEVELMLRSSAYLPDSLFPIDKCRNAVNKLLDGIGIEDLEQRVTIQTVEAIDPAVLAIRLYPPHENLLYENGRGGFEYYRRLAMETGRVLMWAYADSTLPYLLRDYPQGSEEILTGLFEDLALDSAFLAANFKPNPGDLSRFVRHERWLRLFRIRQVILYFLFDYYLSEDREKNPKELYWSLESSLMGCPDSSYHWIETILMGAMSRYPELLSNFYARLKLREILFEKYGSTWSTDSRTGQFIIDEICRPGKSRTIERLIARNGEGDQGIGDIKRQYRLR